MSSATLELKSKVVPKACFPWALQLFGLSNLHNSAKTGANEDNLFFPICPEGSV